MKKIFTLFIIVLWWAGAHAQDAGSYTVEIKIVVNDGNSNHSGQCTNKFEFYGTLNDETQLPVWTESLNIISNWDYTYTKTYTLPANTSLKNIQFFGARNWKNLFDCSANGGRGRIQNIDYFGCTQWQRYTDLIPYWVSTVDIRVIPNAYNIFYFGTNNSYEPNPSSWYLTANDPITLKATSGYTSSLYNWEYRIGNNGAWTSFPTRLSGNSSIVFTGNDISTDFTNNVVLANQPVYVRLTGTCDTVSNTMPIRPLLNTPNISKVGITPQSCAGGANDGAINITMDRALYPGETLTIFIDGVGAVNVTQLDASNSYSLSNLPSGTRNIFIRSLYNGGSTFGLPAPWQVTIPVAPAITYSFSYLGTGTSAEPDGTRWYLPPSTPVTISTTSGYASKEYNWEFQIGNGAWTAFPASFNSRNTLVFSGNDISSNYISAVVTAGQVVNVRLVNSCGVPSSPMALVPVPVTASIIASAPTAPSCFAVSDGKIKITLNRALYSGETLSILVDNGVIKIPNLTQAQFPGNAYTITGVAGGAHTISLSGVYKGQPTFTNSQPWPVVVPDTPFSFATSSSDVHCPGGVDGVINITAQGGKAPYVVLLENSSGDVHPSLITANGSIPELPVDTYMVRLVDSKACSPRDAAGNLIENMVTISEPTPLSVSLLDIASPVPGQSNGFIMVQATGGSGIYSFDWVETNSGATFNAEPPVTITGGMTDILYNLGGGDYQITVRDAQYALADPQNYENTVGCETVFEQTLAASTLRIAADRDAAESHIQQFYVTPNPVHGRFAASVSLRDMGDFTLTLFNSQGVIVSEQRYSAELAVTADFEVPAANQRGVYLLRLTTAEQSSAIRVLVE